MKLASTVMLFVLCIFFGIGALVMITRDNPQYAAGEPIAIVKDWLGKHQAFSSSSPVMPSKENTTGGTKKPAEDMAEVAWTEEYLGHGKWLVSKVELPSNYSETDLNFEEWIAKTRGWDADRLKEYASDLSPEEQEAFQEELRTYDPGQQPVDITDEWYVYEHSGLVEEVKDE